MPPPPKAPLRPKKTTRITSNVPGLLNVPESMSIALHTCLWIVDDPRAFRPSPGIAKELVFSYTHSAKVVQKLVKKTDAKMSPAMNEGLNPWLSSPT